MKTGRVDFNQMMKLSSEFKAVVQWWNEYSSKSGFVNDREANNINDLRELRFRLVSTSERLRMKIIEVNMLSEKVKSGPQKIMIENAFLKKSNTEMYERNKRLNRELLRVKNLI